MATSPNDPFLWRMEQHINAGLSQFGIDAASRHLLTEVPLMIIFEYALANVDQKMLATLPGVVGMIFQVILAMPHWARFLTFEFAALFVEKNPRLPLSDSARIQLLAALRAVAPGLMHGATGDITDDEVEKARDSVLKNLPNQPSTPTGAIMPIDLNIFPNPNFTFADLSPEQLEALKLIKEVYELRIMAEVDLVHFPKRVRTTKWVGEHVISRIQYVLQKVDAFTDVELAEWKAANARMKTLLTSSEGGGDPPTAEYTADKDVIDRMVGRFADYHKHLLIEGEPTMEQEAAGLHAQFWMRDMVDDAYGEAAHSVIKKARRWWNGNGQTGYSRYLKMFVGGIGIILLATVLPLLFGLPLLLWAGGKAMWKKLTGGGGAAPPQTPDPNNPNPNPPLLPDPNAVDNTPLAWVKWAWGGIWQAFTFVLGSLFFVVGAILALTALLLLFAPRTSFVILLLNTGLLIALIARFIWMLALSEKARREATELPHRDPLHSKLKGIDLAWREKNMKYHLAPKGVEYFALVVSMGICFTGALMNVVAAGWGLVAVSAAMIISFIWSLLFVSDAGIFFSRYLPFGKVGEFFQRTFGRPVVFVLVSMLMVWFLASQLFEGAGPTRYERMVAWAFPVAEAQQSAESDCLRTRRQFVSMGQSCDDEPAKSSATCTCEGGVMASSEVHHQNPVVSWVWGFFGSLFRIVLIGAAFAIPFGIAVWLLIRMFTGGGKKGKEKGGGGGH